MRYGLSQPVRRRSSFFNLSETNVLLGYTNGTTPLRLSGSFDIKINVPNAPADLVAAVQRAKGYLANDKLQALVIDRGASSASAISKAKTLPSLTLSLLSNSKGSVKSISEEAIAPIESRVESYTLTVPADGSGAVLKANSTLGLYRGLTTFGQIWYDWNGATYTLSAPIQIADAPAYVRALFISSTPATESFSWHAALPRVHA